MLQQDKFLALKYYEFRISYFYVFFIIDHRFSNRLTPGELAGHIFAFQNIYFMISEPFSGCMGSMNSKPT